MSSTVAAEEMGVGPGTYQNGVVLGVLGALAGDVSNDGALVLGKGPGYPEYKGELDEVALYLGVLSEATIADHHAVGRGSE